MPRGLTQKTKDFLSAAETATGSLSVQLNKSELEIIADAAGVEIPWGYVRKHSKGQPRGSYVLSSTGTPAPTKPKAARKSKAAPKARAKSTARKAAPVEVSSDNRFLVAKDRGYVAPTWTRGLKKMLQSALFMPVYIYGETGTGKTYAILQTAASLKREIIRVNITTETDESDLIGAMVIRDGDMVWQDGPVLTAMKRGAILLIDEIDLASSKVMCLQSVLEGAAYYVKKTGEQVHPQNGFTVIATANTRGNGQDDTGKYIFTGPLNTAFLERFVATMPVGYLTKGQESKVLKRLAEKLNKWNEDAENLIGSLVEWANKIRKMYLRDKEVDEVISTRRLVHIFSMWAAMNDIKAAITLCTNRFDDATKEAFLDNFQLLSGVKLDDDEETGVEEAESVVNEFVS